MYDVIIIGAGPAGLMSAIQASLNYKVLIIEKNMMSGKKLLITGGGRCNVTNLKSNQDFLNQLSVNKKYLYSAINKFGPNDIYDFFISNNVPLKEEENNKIFPVSDKAADILQALLNNITNAEFKYGEIVKEIFVGEIKEVITDKNRYLTKNVIIATGGASYKETGSSGDHLRFAEMLNQPIIPLYPAETSVLLKNVPDLAGTSINEVKVKYLKYETCGNLMFTHKGLSGDAIMKMSEHLYLNEEKDIIVDFLPNMNDEELYNFILNFDREKQLVNCLSSLFTKRFAQFLVDKIGFNNKIKSMHKSDLLEIVKLIKKMSFIILCVEKLDKAYVTGGGVDMNYIDTTSMESKINKGIYFVGEALDIHGPIGGYNITLALATGYLAGTSIK